jgi:glycosyltransferase involved in cell wall biosynthesis
MRIGIDGRALTGRYTGDRTYWLNLLRAYLQCSQETPEDCPHEFIVYSRLPVPPDALPSLPNLTLRTIPASNDRLWTLLTFPRALKQDGVDLAHTQYTTPLHASCPIITTVHDISFRLYPEWFPRKHRLLMNLTVPGSMRRAAMVITDSESSRRDILRIYRLPPERVVGIPLAAGPEFAPIPQEIARRKVKERFHLDRPYVLSVSVLQPRKNLPLLMEAFARARKQTDLPHRLVLTGKRGWGVEGLSRHAARLRLNDAIVYTDYVEDADLPALYSATDAMAWTSLYEGFGLPPLEAMACGAPTLVSEAPAMPEVAGDGAWVLPIMDAVAWGSALARLLTDAALRELWSERGIRRASAFSWERTAARTLAVYDHVARRQGEGLPRKAH